MDCRTALEILDCLGIPDRERIGAADLPAMDLAAAEAHLTECRRCATIVENRRRLDRKIGHAVRAVNLPRGGRERLLAQLAALETPGEHVEVTDGNFAQAAMPRVVPDNLDLADANLANVSAGQTRRKQRWLWRGTVPVAACLLVAAIGFFSVIWLMTPRWSVDEVRLEVAKINFGSFDALRDYNGEAMASRIPRDPGWQKLDWRDRQTAKGLPTTANPHQFALFAFAIQGRQRRPIEGLLAVVPRHRMRATPAARSLSEALSGDPSDYLPAQIGEGEAVSVAWTDGDVVYVCLVEGGADSLDTLKQLLGAPAA